MKKLPNIRQVIQSFAFIALMLATWAATSTLTGCKTPKLEPGGVYTSTNATGQVIYNDVGLALADASYKFAYETALDVMRFERDNRAAIWAISPEIKKNLDAARPTVVDINKRWAEARKMYKANPTPAGLDAIQTILAEMRRILPIIQKQITPVYQALAKPPTP